MRDRLQFGESVKVERDNEGIVLSAPEHHRDNGLLLETL